MDGMENGERDAGEVVARVLEEKEFNSVRPETLVSLVHESGALGRARNLAQDYAQRAKECLNGRDSEFARALATPPYFILERENSAKFTYNSKKYKKRKQTKTSF